VERRVPSGLRVCRKAATAQTIARQSANSRGLPVTTAGVTVNSLRAPPPCRRSPKMAPSRDRGSPCRLMVAGRVESISLVQKRARLNLHRFRESWLEEHKPEILHGDDRDSRSRGQAATTVRARRRTSHRAVEPVSARRPRPVRRGASTRRSSRWRRRKIRGPTRPAASQRGSRFHPSSRRRATGPSTNREGLAALKSRVAVREGRDHRGHASPALRRRPRLRGDGAKLRRAPRPAPIGIFRASRCGVRAREMGIARVRRQSPLGAPACTADQVDLWELNEAFARQVGLLPRQSWASVGEAQRRTGRDSDRPSIRQ